MKEEIKKLAPVSIYDMKGMENWLQKYAAEGYRIEKIGAFFVHFTYIARPILTPIQYRLIPSTRIFLRPKKQDIITSSSWREIPNESSMGIRIYVNYEENAEDLYADDSRKTDFLLKICKSLSNYILWLTLFYVVVTLTLIIISSFDKKPIATLISFDYITAILLFLPVVYISLEQMITKRIVRKQDVGWQISEIHYSAKMWLVIKFIVFIFTILIPLTSLLGNNNTDWSISLKTMPNSVPAIDLRTVEGNSNLYDQDYYPIFVGYKYNLFAPVQYKTHQDGYFVDSQQNIQYEPCLETNYYRLINPYLAEKLMDELINAEINWRGTYPELYESPLIRTELSDTDFDRAYLIKWGDSQYLYALQNNEVISLYYDGTNDISLFTDELQEKMKLAYPYKPRGLKKYGK